MGLREEYSSKNLRDFDSVAKQSNKKFWWICKEGHEWEAVMSSRSKGIGCPYCSGKRILPGYNDLFTVRPELKKYWSVNNTIDPSTVGVGKEVKAKWICDKGHEFESLISNRTRGYGCPYCAGKIPILGENDIETLYPEIAKQYDQEKNKTPLEKVNRGSSSKRWWICSEGHSWKSSVANRTKRGDGCPYCSGRYSIPGKTDIATTHPEIAAQWHPDNDKKPQDVPAGSEYRAKWICPINPNHTWESIVNSRTCGTGCSKCWNGVSSQEEEVFEFLKENLPDLEIQQSVRSVIPPKEIDIYIPELQFAIEVNGLFWHTEEMGKDRKYHRSKFLSCQKQGIQLFTIWQDDWRDRPDVVRSMLLHKLGVSQAERVFARGTEVVSVSRERARLFLDAYHIQGFASGTHYLGLAQGDDLVAVMVLKGSSVMYLERYATSKHVVGGQGKLLSWVRKSLEFDQLVTFADLEVSDGRLYEATGWVRDKVLAPDYKYVVDGKRVHKFNYRLKRFHDDPGLRYEDGLTERELALLNNIPRVWDCGKIRYVIDRG